jgi:peptidase MA superfamily protein/tetratricopeptide repeat protein
MAIPRATRAILFVAFFGVLSALAVAMGLARVAPRPVVAPEAWAALERHDAERAASIFQQELKHRPHDPVLHFGAASAAQALGRTSAALSSLKTAVELDPQFAEALAMLGPIAYESGDSNLAIRSLEKASSLRPRDRRLAELLAQWRRESSVHNSYIEKSARHFRILYEGGTQQHIGDRVSRVLESGYSRIGKTLNSYPTETTVILYTNREFQDITRSPAWAAGGYDGRIRIAVGGAMQSPSDLDRVVTHELVHAIVASAAHARVPAWLNEGLATHLEASDHSWAAAVIRKAATVVPLDNLVNGFSRLDEQSALVAYAESQIAADILTTKLGSNIGAFLQVVGNGSSVDEALLAFQVQPDAFHSEWRRRVGVR